MIQEQETVQTKGNCLRWIMINPFIDHILKFECNSTWCKKFCRGEDTGLGPNLPKY